MNKVDKERYILKLAKTILKKLYGNFDVISEQIDSPDAAISLKSKGNHKIGIEITSVDKQKDLQYLNDDKTTRPIQSEQLTILQNNTNYTERPMKKILIDFPKEYIFDGVFKKEQKYSKYKNIDDYKEVILVAFSSYLKIDFKCFKYEHKPWSEFLLSNNKFSFDKVIFVDIQTQKAVLVYDKNLPLLKEPESNNCIKNDITIIKSSILPFGKSVNIKNMFNEKPLVTIKKK